MPRIAEALARVDIWIAENIGHATQAEVGPQISGLLFKLAEAHDRQRHVIETLRGRDRTTIGDVWGIGPQRDVTRLESRVIEIACSLNKADGCARDIDHMLTQLRMVVADIERKKTLVACRTRSASSRDNRPANTKGGRREGRIGFQRFDE